MTAAAQVSPPQTGSYGFCALGIFPMTRSNTRSSKHVAEVPRKHGVSTVNSAMGAFFSEQSIAYTQPRLPAKSSPPTDFFTKSLPTMTLLQPVIPTTSNVFSPIFPVQRNIHSFIFSTRTSAVMHDHNFFCRVQFQIVNIFSLTFSDTLLTCTAHPTSYDCEKGSTMLPSARGIA